MGLKDQPVKLQTEAPGKPAEPSRYRWYHRAAAMVYVFVCYEVGIVLLFFPWLEWWERNYFSALSPTWYEFWSNPYLRGGISGLGFVNIIIAFSETLRLRRFHKH